MRLFRTLCACVALASLACGQSGSRWPGWNTYQVLMWSTGAPLDRSQWIDRLHELGFTGEECTIGCDAGPFVQKNFGFYVENLVQELAFLHSRESIYKADWNSYTTTHDTQYLWRKPCFHDPNFWGNAKTSLQGYITRYAGQQPLLYQLRDELSLGSYASPMDYCFDPHTLAEFRVWLQSIYGSLDALNQEWETSYQSWDQVMPMTTYEVKDREKAELNAGKPENYAPWADHREFMDITFAQTLDRLRGYVREVDPTRPVGIEGTQMPSAWDGYDLWRLSQVIDLVEPYDIAGSREIFRSFLPPGTPILSTVFGTDYPRIQRELWWLLLHGDRGLIVWDDDAARCILKTQDGQPVTDRGTALASIFAKLKPVAQTMMGLERLDDRIAIHYSQASIRAQWMFDSREDGNTWPRRFSSYEATHSRVARVRDSFQRVIEDLGLQYKFVSYEQVETDELLRDGYKVLMLPQSVAMSARECRQIETFVKMGGTVIADNMTATMDEHCKRLPKGQLDDLFGIQRASVGWSATPNGGALPSINPLYAPVQGFEPGITVVSGTALRTTTDVPVVIVNHVGRGRTVYLNIDMHGYGMARLLPPQGDALRDLFRDVLKDAGIETPVQVLDAESGDPAPGTEVWRYRGAAGDYYAVMRNPEFDAGSLASVSYPDNSQIEKPLRIRIVVPETGSLTNVRTGETYLGGPVEADLDPWSPVILKRDHSGRSSAESIGRPSPVGRRR